MTKYKAFCGITVSYMARVIVKAFHTMKRSQREKCKKFKEGDKQRLKMRGKDMREKREKGTRGKKIKREDKKTDGF